MKDECIICKAPLEYLTEDEIMECAICHKKENSKTRCVNDHFVCNECHMAGIDTIMSVCLSEQTKNPIAIIRKLMDLPFCHMHGPEHHIMVGSALLTAYRNAGGDIDLTKALPEMMKRGKAVPGGACGFWGACGAGISTGMFISIISGSTPLANEPWGLSNRMTSTSLNAIGAIGGPRCCKRNSYLAILSAIDYVKENFNIEMEREDIVCSHSALNNQCIGKRCPFFNWSINTDELMDKLSQNMSAKCYKHSLEVAQNARVLAKKTSVDPDKVYIAGLLHDVAKERSNDELIKLCEFADKYIPYSMKERPHSLHGVAGAYIAYTEYNIRDNEILMAIAYHSGRAAMQTAEKILFLADTIAQSQKYNMPELKIEKIDDLDNALLNRCSQMIKYCIDNDAEFDEKMQDAYDYVIGQIIRRHSDAERTPEIGNDMTDVDEIVKKYFSHSLKLKSVANAYDIGDRMTSFGKSIKRGKLLRSGNLSSVSKSDLETLKDMGIDTIIDLRMPDEIKITPDIITDGFRVYNCQIPRFERTATQQRISEYVKKSITDEETIWYISEYINYMCMNQLFRDALLREDALSEIRRVFDILLDERTHGVLIHSAGGKERAGVISRLIQFMLGVDISEIITDYYLIVIFHSVDMERAKSILAQQYANSILDMKDVFSETIGKYVNEYLKLSNEQIAALHDKYLKK